MVDYLTCLGASNLRYQNWSCAFHDCSCSNAMSTIVLNGSRWELPFPLDIEMPGMLIKGIDGNITNSLENVSSFWSAYELGVKRPKWVNKSVIRSYSYNETALWDTDILESGRCVAEGAYSWGFSSLILLTFCLYTTLFAVSLILLQTDVYWNSRYDRKSPPQSYSMYSDILYIADELKARFSDESIGSMAQSPETLEEMIGRARQGLHLDVSELPPSRVRDWIEAHSVAPIPLSNCAGAPRTATQSAEGCDRSIGYELSSLSSQENRQLASSDTPGSTSQPGPEGSTLSSLGDADARSSSDRNATLYTTVGTPATSSISEEQRLIEIPPYENERA